MAEQEDWRDVARMMYREASSELLSHPGVSTDDMVEFYKEELREAMLDLKQAVIEDRMNDAVVSINEVRVCLFELKNRW
jgi:hypothetical protein